MVNSYRDCARPGGWTLPLPLGEVEQCYSTRFLRSVPLFLFMNHVYPIPEGRGVL